MSERGEEGPSSPRHESGIVFDSGGAARSVALRGRLVPDVELGGSPHRVAEASGGFTPPHLKGAILSAALVVAREVDGEANPNAGFEELLTGQVSAPRAYPKSTLNPTGLGESAIPKTSSVAARRAQVYRSDSTK